MNKSLWYIALASGILFTCATAQEPEKISLQKRIKKTQEKILIIYKEGREIAPICLYSMQTFCSAFFFIYLQIWDEDPYALEMFDDCLRCKVSRAFVKFTGHVTFISAFINGCNGLIKSIFKKIKDNK